MSDNLRQRINLFYYNLFRFERFTQNLISYPIDCFVRFTGLGKKLAKRSGRENWDEYIRSVLNNPKGGISLNMAGNQVIAHLLVLFITPWNIFCGLARPPHNIYWAGWVVIGILAFSISFYIAPDDPKRYLKDFRKFESMPKVQKRNSALVTLLIVIGIWSFFVVSFIYYLRSIT